MNNSFYALIGRFFIITCSMHAAMLYYLKEIYMAELEINGKKISIKTALAKRAQTAGRIMVAGVGQKGSNTAGNEGVYISTEYYRNDISGKPYPGRINFNTQRVLAYNSTVVRAILTLRAHQVAKLPFSLVPSDKKEPPRQISVLEYSVYGLDDHPAFDEAEKVFLRKIYEKLDPEYYISDKKGLFEEKKDEFTPAEISTVEHLQNKHDAFYRKRSKDIKNIKRLLDDPDPWFTDTRSWGQLLKSILMDLLILDRGIFVIVRDEDDKIRGLMPIDGSTVRPLINEYGTYDNDKAYVQVVHGSPQVYFKKRDVVVMKMNPMTDMKYFGYGLSNMETLYTDSLADIFIDKGQLDFYRKGGSIPEGFIAIEPMSGAGAGNETAQAQFNQESLETFQRHLAAIMMGDYTQVPIFSGGKISYIDFKGRRRDMQYKELAEYLTRKICAVYQVSPQDVGITANVNRSTSETQAEMTRSKGLETLMRVISEYVTQRIVNEMRPERDLMLWFEDDDLDKKKIEWNIAQQKLVSGALSINQYRASQGEHPVPWGNTPLQGRKNWVPEDKEQDATAGFPGGLPPLPQLGGGLPQNPAGGDNPGAGGPKQPPGGPSPLGSPTNLKSSRFFTMKATTEAEAEELMIKGFTEMYEADFPDLVELHDINNYPGGKWVRSPMESYEYFVSSHPALGITIKKSSEEDDKDPFKFSSYDKDGTITVTEDGESPLIHTMAEAVVDKLDEDKLQSIFQVGGEDRVLESVEMAIYKSLDPALHSALYESFYKFKPTSLTDAQIDQTGEILEL